MVKKVKKVVLHMFFLIYTRRKIDSYDPLPLEKKLNWHDVIILIKSVLSKNKNHYYFNIF